LGLFCPDFTYDAQREHGCFVRFYIPTLKLGRHPPNSRKQADICPGYVLNWGVETAATRLDTARPNILHAKRLARFLQLLFGHACLGLRLGLLLVTSNLCLAGPANSLQPLGQNGVAVVVGGVHPVGIHGRKVLDLELNERRSEFGGVAELVREGIYEKG
jgi:hypothetical protein